MMAMSFPREMRPADSRLIEQNELRVSAAGVSIGKIMSQLPRVNVLLTARRRAMDLLHDW